MSHLQPLVSFINLVDPQINTTAIDNVFQAIEVLEDLFDSDCKPFKKHFDQLISLLEAMIMGMIGTSEVERNHMLDFVIQVVKKCSKLIQQKQRITKVYKIILNMIVLNVEDPTPAWMNPPNEISEDDTELNEDPIEKNIFADVAVFSEKCKLENIVNFFQPLFLQYIQNHENWKYQYSALMIASQIVPQKATAENMKVFAEWALMAIKHPHPKVRYASLHLIGQYSEDLNPEFQDLFYEKFVPLTVDLFQDTVPRVVAHTFSCIVNFFDKCEQNWKIESILDQYLNFIIYHIKNGNAWIMEKAVSALSSLATIQNTFGSQLPQLFELNFTILATFLNKREYFDVVNAAIETLSIFICHQNKKIVEPYIPQFLTTLFSSRDHIKSLGLLNGWQRICINFDKFTDINQYFPILFQICKEGMKQFILDEETTPCLITLTSTFNSFQEEAAPFAQQVLKFAQDIVAEQSNSIDVRQCAFGLSIAIVTKTKPSDPHNINSWLSMAQYLYNAICQELEDNFAAQSLTGELPFLFEDLKDLIESMGKCLPQNDLISIAEKSFYFLSKIQEEINVSKDDETNYEDIDGSSEQTQSIEQEFVVNNEEDLEDLEQCCDEIPEIFEKILKCVVDPAVKMQIVEKIHQEIEKFIGEKGILLQLGINMALHLFEAVEYQEVSPIWSKYTQIFVHFSNDKNPRIRNGAIYGLSLIIQKSPLEVLGQAQTSSILTLLSQAYTSPFEQNEKNQFFVDHCKENVISALGMLLKHKTGNYPEILNKNVFDYWLSHLPLNTDLEEGNKQQSFLLEILNHDPTFLIKEAQHLKQILEIFVKFIQKRRDPEYREIVQKSREFLQMITKWDFFQESGDYLFKNLSNSHRNSLNSLINSDS